LLGFAAISSRSLVSLVVRPPGPRRRKSLFRLLRWALDGPGTGLDGLSKAQLLAVPGGSWRGLNQAGISAASLLAATVAGVEGDGGQGLSPGISGGFNCFAFTVGR